MVFYANVDFTTYLPVTLWGLLELDRRNRKGANHMSKPRAISLDTVCVLALLHAFASFVHHLHNAVYLADYPNMPVWLTPASVMVAWAFVASVGAAGGVLLYHGFETAGYCVLGIFAALGFCGLDHYAIANMSQHTIWMNATILFEVATALALFLVIAVKLPGMLRSTPSIEAT